MRTKEGGKKAVQEIGISCTDMLKEKKKLFPEIESTSCFGRRAKTSTSLLKHCNS